MNKRDFLRTVGGASLGLAFGPELMAQYAAVPAATLAEDEPFWAAMRTRFRLTSEYINLENGYYCFQPEDVLESFITHVRRVNLMGSRYMRTVKDDDKLRVRTRLAALAGCSPAELIITRNGKPAAVLISADEFESLQETREIRRDPALLADIRKGLAELDAGKGLSFEDVFGEPLAAKKRRR